MREDYKAAKKLADEAVKEAARNGTSPYLPVLDEIEDIKSASSEIRLGLMELPVSRIIGNKEAGRNNAFANNFMPLLEDGSEFANKWSNLYDSFLNEGIRDAVKVYEYMNDYYVQEGNKRVSVAKFGDMEFILADVRRIMPKPNDSKEYKVYCEYLDFYSVTKNVYIVFSEPGEYTKLAELLGEDLKTKWPDSLCTELKLAYFSFCKKCRTVLKMTDDRQLSEAFLMYISIFPMKTLSKDTQEQIVKNIKLASSELESTANNISFIESAPETVSQGVSSRLKKLLTGKKKYTAASPLRVAFIYPDDPETSRWTDSHEAGRLYVNMMAGSNVSTRNYIGSADAIERAIKDKNEIIFAVSPSMIPDALTAAVKHPSVQIICCSVGEKHTSLRYYHGKLYEATFLMGILAADRLLLEGNDTPRKIGYIVRPGSDISTRDLNAFAVGVSLIDPQCMIILGSDVQAIKQQGIIFYADFDYSGNVGMDVRPGLYKAGENKDEYIGAPYFSWGKYYVQIVQSVLSGALELNPADNKSVSSYWFGLSTGVVDIRANNLSYQTSKMLAFFKNSIVNGGFDPFTGELHTQSGDVLQEDYEKHVGVSVERKTMTAGSIAFMDWLNDNIQGDLKQLSAAEQEKV